jgi:hypothetical protein
MTVSNPPDLVSTLQHTVPVSETSAPEAHRGRVIQAEVPNMTPTRGSGALQPLPSEAVLDERVFMIEMEDGTMARPDFVNIHRFDEGPWMVMYGFRPG